MLSEADGGTEMNSKLTTGPLHFIPIIAAVRWKYYVLKSAASTSL